ncbi:actin-binding Rho-activating protein-like isoform X2 [Arctopsyche grandis]|uniref:actin-binding Rho-activating protein-like isoform X2 n=1 Tax=Arctopsyche grandis TaxID=121162 RepID=UPI00406D8554
MSDLGHEISVIKFVVDSSLQDKVARFNNVAAQHKQSQQLNPFSDSCGQNGKNFLKPKFGSEDYGRPAPGSLTEARGVKAFSHVCKEMLELCEVINEFGELVDVDVKAISFGYLFEIYTRINDKLVGLLLRSRKHEFIAFEGECLFQRRDDDVPVYLIKPIAEIRHLCEEKVEAARRSITPTPQ